MRPSFIGLIGPNVKTATSLFSLFTSNGILQGIFLNDSTSISHLIQTERVRRTWFPHPGVANTAILSVYDKDYAMFERDLPYELDITYPTVRTLGKIRAPFHSLSAHSTFSPPFIHSMTYSLLHRTVSFLTLSPTFQPLFSTHVRTRYLPLVHDYLRHAGTFVFTESPLCLRLARLPFYLHPSKPTRIHVVPDVYTSPLSFFIFHYAGISENSTSYTLYAPVYDKLSFDNVDLSGKYRRLILDKATRTILMETNSELEVYNLDFPIRWKHFILLRNLCIDHINGFVLCEGLTIVRTYFLNVSVLGEPYIHEDTLYCFTSSSFLELDLNTGKYTSTPVYIPGTIGFHAFAKYNKSNSNAGSS